MIVNYQPESTKDLIQLENKEKLDPLRQAFFSLFFQSGQEALSCHEIASRNGEILYKRICEIYEKNPHIPFEPLLNKNPYVPLVTLFPNNLEEIFQKKGVPEENIKQTKLTLIRLCHDYIYFLTIVYEAPLTPFRSFGYLTTSIDYWSLIRFSPGMEKEDDIENLARCIQVSLLEIHDWLLEGSIQPLLYQSFQDQLILCPGYSLGMKKQPLSFSEFVEKILETANLRR
jgi:hypothetical protein